MYVYQDVDMVLRQIQDSKEYMDLRQRVATDLSNMKSKAVEFLKAQGKWPAENN